MGQTRVLAAEFLGTFALVFIGAGSIVTDQARSGALGVLGVAVAFGLVLAVMVTALMRISGAHFNPAVTLALLMTKHVDAKTAGLYVVAQFVGAVAAAYLVMFVFPPLAGELVGYGVPRIGGDVGFRQAIVIEAVLTFFLVSAVYGTIVSREAPAVGGVGIGLTVLFCVLVGGPLTGAALNPARALGPALVANDWTAQAAFWVGPLFGGAVAALIWGKVLLPKNLAD